MAMAFGHRSTATRPPHILSRDSEEVLQAREIKGPLSYRSQVSGDALRRDPRPAFHYARFDDRIGGVREEQRDACAGQPFGDFLDKLRGDAAASPQPLQRDFRNPQPEDLVPPPCSILQRNRLGLM